MFGPARLSLDVRKRVQLLPQWRLPGRTVSVFHDVIDTLASNSGPRRARGLDRALETLEFLHVKGQPIRPNEIAAEIGAPTSSVCELVNLLLGNGMLDYQAGDGRVFLSRRPYFLGTAYAEQFDLMRERDVLGDLRKKREKPHRCVPWKAGNTLCDDARRHQAFPHLLQYRRACFNSWDCFGGLLVSHLSDQPVPTGCSFHPL